MSIERYETKLHKRADKAHEDAQNSGLPEKYIYAAQLYELAGDYVRAAECRDAAERLARK